MGYSVLSEARRKCFTRHVCLLSDADAIALRILVIIFAPLTLVHVMLAIYVRFHFILSRRLNILSNLFFCIRK